MSSVEPAKQPELKRGRIAAPPSGNQDLFFQIKNSPDSKSKAVCPIEGLYSVPVTTSFRQKKSAPTKVGVTN